MAIIEETLHIENESALRQEFAVTQEAYTVDDSLMDSLERSLVDQLRCEVGSDGPSVVTVVVPPESPYANFGRMSETIAYEGYNNHTAMETYEGRSIWLFTVDINPFSKGGIDHVKRLVPALPEEDRVEGGLTGIEVIDDRLTSENPHEVLDLQSLQDYHGITDIGRIWNVTSNHATGRVHPASSLESAMNTLRSYKATYLLGKEAGIDTLFAYLNVAAIKSLGRTGVKHELLLGREFHLPEPGKPGEYDSHYTAVSIPYTEENQACFTQEFTFEPTGDSREDHRLETRAFISAFIANEAVQVFEVAEDQTTLTRRI